MAVTSDKVTQKRTRKPVSVSPTPEKDVAKEVEKEAGKVLVRMERGARSWTTHDGVRFTKDHPYQLVAESEVDLLLMEGGFRRAHPDELKQWYGEDE